MDEKIKNIKKMLTPKAEGVAEGIFDYAINAIEFSFEKDDPKESVFEMNKIKLYLAAKFENEVETNL